MYVPGASAKKRSHSFSFSLLSQSSLSLYLSLSRYLSTPPFSLILSVWISLVFPHVPPSFSPCSLPLENTRKEKVTEEGLQSLSMTPGNEEDCFCCPTRWKSGGLSNKCTTCWISFFEVWLRTIKRRRSSLFVFLISLRGGLFKLVVLGFNIREII